MDTEKFVKHRWVKNIDPHNFIELDFSEYCEGKTREEIEKEGSCVKCICNSPFDIFNQYDFAYDNVLGEWNFNNRKPYIIKNLKTRQPYFLTQKCYYLFKNNIHRTKIEEEEDDLDLEDNYDDEEEAKMKWKKNIIERINYYISELGIDINDYPDDKPEDYKDKKYLQHTRKKLYKLYQFKLAKYIIKTLPLKLNDKLTDINKEYIRFMKLKAKYYELHTHLKESEEEFEKEQQYYNEKIQKLATTKLKYTNRETLIGKTFQYLKDTKNKEWHTILANYEGKRFHYWDWFDELMEYVLYIEMLDNPPKIKHQRVLETLDNIKNTYIDTEDIDKITDGYKY